MQDMRDHKLDILFTDNRLSTTCDDAYLKTSIWSVIKNLGFTMVMIVCPLLCAFATYAFFINGVLGLSVLTSMLTVVSASAAIATIPKVWCGIKEEVEQDG